MYARTYVLKRDYTRAAAGGAAHAGRARGRHTPGASPGVRCLTASHPEDDHGS